MKQNTARAVLHRSPHSRKQTSTVDSSAAIQSELRSLVLLLGSQSKLAEMLHVDRSSVNRWIKGEDVPDAENKEKIIALRYVLTRLTRMFEEEVAISWLHGINGYLNEQRPIDLLRNGRLSEVISAVEQTETGSYA